METVLTNAYTCMDQKSRVFKTNSIAIGTKELLQTSKTSFFYKMELFVSKTIKTKLLQLLPPEAIFFPIVFLQTTVIEQVNL